MPRAHGARVGELVGGKYRVERFLAEGGMGAVFEAQHTVIRRRFAIKFLHADLVDQRDFLTRFHREADAAGALQSEHIAAILDFGIGDDGTPFIVMEHLVGESLAALLQRRRRLPIGRAADICLQACRGMEAAHQAGIIHRDLKPQNLFICRRADGTDLVKVLDFGVAKLQSHEGHTTITGAGTVLGTPLYMSPEQARGDERVDHRTDVYALGAILYEMLSGQRPHPGDSPNAVLFHIFTQAPVPLDTVQPGLLAALRDLVESALSFDPAARPGSARQLGRALLPLAKREPWPEPEADTLPSSGDAADTVRAPSGVEPAARIGPRPEARRHARPSLIAAAVAALALLVAVVVARPARRWHATGGQTAAANGPPPGTATPASSSSSSLAAASSSPGATGDPPPQALPARLPSAPRAPAAAPRMEPAALAPHVGPRPSRSIKPALASGSLAAPGDVLSPSPSPAPSPSSATPPGGPLVPDFEAANPYGSQPATPAATPGPPDGGVVLN